MRKVSAPDARFIAETAADIREREVGRFSSADSREDWIVGFVAGFLTADSRVEVSPTKAPN